jgi:Arf-GAP/SH3 domain/ANK repeat/PH domain-containing protein
VLTPNDTLGSLPTIRSASKDSSSASSVASQAPAGAGGSGSGSGSAEREKEKLSKRGSAGARFAGKVASLGIDR